MCPVVDDSFTLIGFHCQHRIAASECSVTSRKPLPRLFEKSADGATSNEENRPRPCQGPTRGVEGGGVRSCVDARPYPVAGSEVVSGSLALQAGSQVVQLATAGRQCFTQLIGLREVIVAEGRDKQPLSKSWVASMDRWSCQQPTRSGKIFSAELPCVEGQTSTN